MDDMLDHLCELARAAGSIELDVLAAGFDVRDKADASPVTEADVRAEALVVDGLGRMSPQWPIVAEEAVAAGHSPVSGDRFWLVDALDGTREFVAGNAEFTVNIALVEHGVPVMGVVHAPALGLLFAGRLGVGAFVVDSAGRRAIRTRSVPAGGITVLASRSHGDEQALRAFLAGRPVAAVRHAGSSLKFGMLAAGEADLYPRFGRTMEWDTAAGHAVLAAAGGEVTDLSGRPLRYGKAGFENPHFVATAAPAAW
jgi:3'(2'), 5'-bisphosphate nucleotidase